MTVRVIVLLGVLLSFCAAARAGDNLITNPSMETWSGAACTGWTGVDGGAVSQDAADHTGQWALQVAPSQAYSGVNQNNIALESGERYRLTCWIRGYASGDTQAVRLMMYTGGTYLPTVGTGTLSTTAFQPYEYVFTVPAGISALNLNIVSFSAPVGGFSFLLDDVRLEKISATGANLGMETWSGGTAAGWSGSGGGSYAQSATASGGSYALRVIPTAAYSGVNQNAIPFTAGQTYRMTCRLRGAASGDIQPLRLMMYSGGTYLATVSTGNLSGTTYQTYEYLFTVPAGLTSLNLNVVTWSAPSGGFSFLMDDVDFELVSAVGTNTNFEQWTGTPLLPLGWSVLGTGTSVSRSTTARSGSYSASVTPGGLEQGLRQSSLAVSANSRYRLRGWLRGGGSGQDDAVRLMVADHGSGGPFYTMADTQRWCELSDSQWREFALEFWTGPDTSSIDVELLAEQYPSSNPLTFLVDDVGIEWLETWTDAAAPADLLASANGDLESWSGGAAVGWSNTIAGSTHAQSATAHTGSYAALVTPTATYGGLRKVSVPVQGSTTYQLSAWLRGAGTGLSNPALPANGGMETWAGSVCTGWAGIDGGSYVNSAVVHGGNAALEVIPTAAYSGVNQYDVAVTPLATYRLTCWLRGGSDGDTQELRLMMYTGGTYLTCYTGTISDKVYKKYTFDFNVPAGVTQMHLNICCPAAPASGFTFLVDDVSLTKIYDASQMDCVRMLAIDWGASPTQFFQADTATLGGLVDGQWRRFNMTFTTRAGATALELELSAYQDPSANPIAFLVDDVSLTPLTSSVVDVTTLGAQPSDGVDDTQALMAAINRLGALDSPTLVFPPGRYDFAQAENFAAPMISMMFEDVDGLTVRGNGAFLVGGGLTRLMQFEDCDNLSVSGVSVDFDREPFSVGKVVSNSGTATSFDVEIFDDYPVQGGEEVQAYLEYDPSTRRPQRGGLDEYYTVTATQLVAPQTLRLYLNNSVAITKDRWIHLRHQVYGYESFRFDRCSDVSLNQSVIFCCPGMGVHATDSENLTVDAVAMAPRPHTDNLMGVTADGVHANSTRGLVRIEDSLFEGLGDDGGNVHGMYFSVQSKVNSTTVDVRQYSNYSELYLPRVGDTVEFSPATTMVPYGAATVASVTPYVNGTAYHRLTFTGSVPASVAAGHLAASVQAVASVRYSGNKVRANRGRGFLASARDVQITGNCFDYCSNGSVLVITEIASFGESIGTDDLYIENNLSRECNFNKGACEGDITVAAYLAGWSRAAAGAHKDAVIRYNTIKNTGQSAIAVCSTRGVSSTFKVESNTLSGICQGVNRGEGQYAVYLLNDQYGSVRYNTLTNPGVGYVSSTYTSGCSSVTISNNTGF